MAPIVVTAPALQLDALFLPFLSGQLRWPDNDSVLFLRARDGAPLCAFAPHGWRCEQTFKPFADELSRAGLVIGQSAEDDRFALVLMLPPRQRDEARALFARAVRRALPGGIVLAAVPNAEGAKSAQADFARLFGRVGSLSKHKCRVFWSTVDTDALDTTCLAEWSALDAPRRIQGGFLSRPGLFAWDRVDAASALLAANLPGDLRGHVADLGAGYGYLATQVVARCPDVTALDLYEAESRALEPARTNLAEAVRESGRELTVQVHWHDVTAGIPRRYDAIVSNPPFHQGRADLPELGIAFIAAAAHALVPHGRLWMVANRHLPYEGTLAAHFAQVRTVALQGGFKVIEAVRA